MTEIHDYRELVIRAGGLGKRYFIDHQQKQERYTSLRDVVANAMWRTAGSLARFVNQPSLHHSLLSTEEFWALKDVSFQISRGEVVGVIGRNGAGKSTLLKVLSRITEPTAGRVEIRGRVASLLEVGTGFHPELTGRENIFLNGAILGMTRAEIRRKFDEIVAFAEVERFLDTPVKRYSSGMYVRLAFAVAAHLEPEILIVDEVLAVGDAEFQSKCLGKMQAVAGHGRTVLFVSHNMPAIEQLCTRAIWMDRGAIRASGSVSKIVSEYLMSGARAKTCYTSGDDPSRPVEISSIAVCDKDGALVDSVTASDILHLRITVLLRARRTDLKLAVALNDMNEQPLFSSCPLDDGVSYPSEPGHYHYLISFPAPILMPQRYSVSASAYSPLAGTFHHCQSAITFEVLPGPTRVLNAEPNRVGVLQVCCKWRQI